MFGEMLARLGDWGQIDFWIAGTAALASAACALPGVFLLLRRQSLLGDALSHTSLLGVVAAYLFAAYLQSTGWLSHETYMLLRHSLMLGGAILAGVLAGWLAETIEESGGVETSAALGVVFTTMFALGLLLIRAFADRVDLDIDCVLYGSLETIVLDTYRGTTLPHATIANALMLLVNTTLVVLFYKELQLSTFDPALGTALGFPTPTIRLALTAVTAATLVTAFESVGSILVVAMLITPAAAAFLLTDRLHWLLPLAAVIAAASAFVGHAAAIAIPGVVAARVGLSGVEDASTSGMTAAVAGGFFVLALLFAPRHGVVSKLLDQTRIALQIVGDDVIGVLYRLEEADHRSVAERRAALEASRLSTGSSSFVHWLACRRLQSKGRIEWASGAWTLTDAGRDAAREVIRSHRLWESYVVKHFGVPDDQVHQSADRAEHYIDDAMQAALEVELEQPPRDPHGKEIPPKV